MVQLVIKNGMIVGPSGVVYGGIAIDDGKIVSICSDKELPAAKRTIDAKGNFVIPGLIDPHVHVPATLVPKAFDEITREQFSCETEGALHGGVTSFAHMTVLIPSASNLNVLDVLSTVGEKSSYVDFFMNACITSELHLNEQEELWRRGVTSFKHFFNAYKGEEGGGVLSPTDEAIAFRSLLFIAEHGYPGLALFHCEEIDPFYVLAEKLRSKGRNDLAAWSEARPNWLEAKRVYDVIEMAKGSGCPALYIVHMSTAEAVDIVADARKNGYQVYSETCPHYLTHTCEMEELGCWGKVNPPLRYKPDIDRLWRGIVEGSVTSMGTDHCPFSRKDKEEGQGGKGKLGNIWKAGPGLCAGMQHTLPVLMTHGVLTGRISIEDLVRVCSTNSARAFGLYPRKGILAVGSDADVVIVDPNKETLVDDKYYKCTSETSIYKGWKFKGTAKTVLVRGEVMMEDYETIGKPGHGRFLRRNPY